MKIKLISPKMSLRPMDSEFKRLMTPSISLLVLAALTPEYHEVEILDENISPLADYDRADLIGITCNVDTYERARHIASRFMTGGSPVIMGGIFPSACPDIAGQSCNSVCVGEAELLWPQILSDVERGQLKRKYYSTEIPNSDLIPRPKWESINSTRYLYTNVVTTSRGCPHGCEFCYNSCEYTIKKYRRRPIPSIMEEIEQLGTKQVLFVDDNFIGNTTWLNEFLAAISPLNLNWHAAVSTDIGNKLGLMDQMAKTGCRSLFIGFESINQGSVASVHKRQNKVSEYRKTIDEIHTRDIMINASLVFGFDCDGPQVFNSTLDWLVDNRIETMTAHILTPYPGTKLYARLEQEKRIVDHNLAHYNTAHVVFRPTQMTQRELLDGYLHMYREFYSWRNIFKRTPRSKNLWYPYFLFNFGYRKFGNLTSQLGRLGLMSSVGKAARRLSYGIG